MTTHQYVAAALAALASMAVQAQLPPPPASPAPVVNYEYDAQGNPTRMIQAPGVPGLDLKTVNTYDSLSRIKDSTDPKLGKTQLGYDGLNRITKVTDPRNLITQYPRNGLGSPTQVISPDTGTATHTFDAAGNIKTRTDSRGVKATYTWDALNRLTKIAYSQSGQPNEVFAWGYDAAGVNGAGRLTSSTHPFGSTASAYDVHGNVLTDTQTIKGAAGANPTTEKLVVTYGYGAGGQLISITYPSGRKLHIGYTNSEVTSLGLARNDSQAPVPLFDQVQYEPDGAARSWRWQLATGPQLYERSYDLSGRLVRYRLGPVVRDLTYDAADRITAYTHYDAATGVPQPNLNQSFSYDENGRLISVAANGSNWTIGYDSNGNRTGVALNGTPRSYATSATSNRLDSISNPARSFSYDGAGNTLSDSGSYTATYDLSGRLASLTKGGVTSVYHHDGFGRRVRKVSSTGAANTVLFAYDLNGQLLGEYNKDGQAMREYVWFGSTPVAMFTPDLAAAKPTKAAPLLYFIHADQLNTPRLLVDKTNSPRWRWIAEPFGTSTPETNPSGLGALFMSLRFPGQYADAESGLNYNYFRSYDASTGRYTQSDPIGLAGGINTYAYVDGNPISDTDPAGLRGGRIPPDEELCQWDFRYCRQPPPPPPKPKPPPEPEPPPNVPCRSCMVIGEVICARFPEPADTACKWVFEDQCKEACSCNPGLVCCKYDYDERPRSQSR